MLLHERLTTLRRKHDLTIEHLSELSGVPEGTLAKIMSGNTRNPSYDNVHDILTAMGEPITALEDEQVQHQPVEIIRKHPCDNCHALTASRDSYTHACDELKIILRQTQRWLIIVTAYSMVITFIALYFAAFRK